VLSDRPRFLYITVVVKRLSATGLRGGELDLMAQPLEREHDRFAHARIDCVYQAGRKQVYMC
jgi:hypothetical protein